MAEVLSTMIRVSDFVLSRGFDEISMVMTHNTRSRYSKHLGGPNKMCIQGSASPCNIEHALCHKGKVTISSSLLLGALWLQEELPPFCPWVSEQAILASPRLGTLNSSEHK